MTLSGVTGTDGRIPAIRKIGPCTPQFWQSWPVRLTDRLSQPQKIVVVLALGMAFGAAGTYLVGLGNTSAFGWYAYAPLSQAAYPATGCTDGRACSSGWR
jgi:hypothetical protein